MDREEVDILHPLTSLEWGECSGPLVQFGIRSRSVYLNGKIYVSGATGGWPSFNKRAAARLYIYTPASDTWVTIDAPVYDFALTVYHSQLVLVGGMEYIGQYSGGRPSNKVWTLGEDGQWRTTLPILKVACTDASAVSHGDHLFVIDSAEGVYIYNGHYWATAQHPTFTEIVSILSVFRSTVINGCLYVMKRDGEVRYASLDSLVASSETKQSLSVWQTLPDTPVGGCTPAKFGNRLIAVRGRIIYAFSPVTQSWVEVGGVPHSLAVSCAIVLPSNELMVMESINTYKVTIKVSPFDLQSHFTVRALSFLEAAGIPLMSSLGHYTKDIAMTLWITIRPLLHAWQHPQTKATATYPPTWNSLLQITRQLELHDLAERIETYLKSTTVDHRQKETVAKEGIGEEMSVHDEIIYQLKQENASLRGEVKLLKSENEQLRTQSLPIKREEVKTELKEEAVALTKAEPSSDKAVAMASWDLPGVEVCGEMSVVVHSSRYQPIIWESFGLRLHIQEDSLPAGIEQCTLNIKASLAGQYEFPENSSLVSAVFWLRCEPICKFTKPVTVEIQHCAKSENVDSLNMKFVRALCSQAQLPYTFKELGGDFNRHSSYGVIQVNGFSGLAVTQEGSEEREYCSQLFYLGQLNSYKINFVVTWNIEAHLTVVKEEYARKGAVLDLQQPVDFELDSITLDIPMEGLTIKPWKITPQMRPVVTKKQVDNFKKGKLTPCCQLLAKVSGRRKQVPSVSHQVSLKGAKFPHDVFLINLPQSVGESSSPKLQTFGDLVATAVAGLGPPPNKKSRLENDCLATVRTSQPAAGGSSQQDHSHTRLTSHHHTALLDQLENQAARWRDIGAKLNFRQGELDNIQAYPVSTLDAPKSYLSRLLSQWLEWAPGDGRGSEGFATLERLKDALRQTNLGATAHDLKLYNVGN